MNMDIYHAVKKARQEIREIRRRYAAKKTGCFIQGNHHYHNIHFVHKTVYKK